MRRITALSLGAGIDDVAGAAVALQIGRQRAQEVRQRGGTAGVAQRADHVLEVGLQRRIRRAAVTAGG